MCHQEAYSNVSSGGIFECVVTLECVVTPNVSSSLNVSSGGIFECVIRRHIRMCHQEAYSNVLSDAHSNVSSDAHSNVSPDDTFKRIYSFLNIFSSLLSAGCPKKNQSFVRF